jgi:hypothetical protein
VSSFNSQFQTKTLIDRLLETEEAKEVANHHNWEWQVMDEPDTMMKRFHLYCRLCGSRATTVALVNKPIIINDLIDKVKMKLRELIRTDFVPDCKEAKLLNICSQVHNS